MCPTKIQTSSYVMDHRDWPGKQWWAECQACCCTRLTVCFSQTVKPFWWLILSLFCFFMYPFFFKIVHDYVDKTESLSTCRIFSKLLFCRQPILLTKHLSTTALILCKTNSYYFMFRYIYPSFPLSLVHVLSFLLSLLIHLFYLTVFPDFSFIHVPTISVTLIMCVNHPNYISGPCCIKCNINT